MMSIKQLIFLIVLSLPFFSAKNFAQKSIVANVKDFGAVGDGKTDDYAALLKVVDYINQNRKGEVYFPKGNYYIAEFHSGKNNIRDLQFENCDGLYIHGSDAIISVNGKFNRTLTNQNGRFKVSNISAVIPLKIDHCKNTTIENLELNGNVNEMTRDSDVIEAGSHLLVINESQKISIINVFTHHAQTDGIYIKGASTKNITGKGIISSNNARQGMSVIELTNATFTGCKFINTGITEGKYGRHAPSAGVDIEPNTKQQQVKNIHFVTCLFENNLGSQFVCSSPVTSQNIFLNNCVFNSNINSSKYAIIVNAENVVFENSSFDCKNGSIYPVWHKDSSSCIFRKCYIKSNISGFVAVNTLSNCKVIIDSCYLEYSGTKKVASFFPYIKMQNLSFTNNVIKIPEQYKKNSGNDMLIKSGKPTSGNVFQNN